MEMSAVRPTDDEIVKTFKRYSNMLYKLCFTILCNKADAQDTKPSVVQQNEKTTQAEQARSKAVIIGEYFPDKHSMVIVNQQRQDFTDM